MKVVLDTHTLLWHLLNPEKLSTKARMLIKKEVGAGRKLLVSSFSIWETYLLAQKKRITLDISPDAWLQRTEELSYLEFVPVDNKIAAESVALNGNLHKDPVDRIIIATAQKYGATIITKDQRIRNYPHVQSIW